MSHDRGCPCGREKWDYASCPEEDCHKKETKMEDTDWRPSPCPGCGEMREAARHPVCKNTNCEFYHLNVKSYHQAENERTMTQNTSKRYVWIRADGEAKIIDTDIVELWQDPCFSKKEDRIYELGAEVEIKVTVAVKNKPVYRGERSYAEGTR